MELLLIVLNKEEYLDDILAAFLELGIVGATVIDSTGMSAILAHDVPIFAGLRQLTRGSRPYNKTIFALIKDESVVDELLMVLKDMGIDFTAPGTGIIITLPITRKLSAPEEELE